MRIYYKFLFNEKVSDVVVDRLIDNSFNDAKRKFGARDELLEMVWTVEDGVVVLKITNTAVGRYIFEGCVSRFKDEFGKDKFTFRKLL